MTVLDGALGHWAGRWLDKLPGRRTLKLTLASNGVIFVASIGTSVLMARLLGPADRGTVARIMYWPGLASGLFCLSLNEALVVVLGKDPARRSDRVRTALALSAGLAAVASAVLATALPFLLSAGASGLLGEARLFSVAFVTASLVSMILIAEDQSAGRFGRYNLLRVLQQLALLAGLAVLWLTKSQSPATVLAAVALSLGVPFTARIVHYIAGEAGHLNAPDARGLLRTGARIQLLNVSGYLATQMDQAFLSFLLSAHDFGLYAVALAVGSAHATIVGTSVSAVDFPRLAALQDQEAALRQAIDGFRKPLRLSLVGSVILTPLAFLAVPIVYGKDFSGAALPAVLLSLGTAARAYRSYLSYAARALGLIRTALFGEWTAAGATLVLLPVLTTSYGLTGAAVAVTAANWLGLAATLGPLSRRARAVDAASSPPGRALA